MNEITTARGSCLCGAVRFHVQLPSKWVAHCHCSFCQRAHGAAFVTWAGFSSDHFAVDADSPAQPTWFESSPGARRAFCPRCGSPMFFESTRWPDETHVARVLIADPLDREPQAHVFYETHVPWLAVNDGLPKKPSQAATRQQAAVASPVASDDAAGG
ncbi:GFA family protein [Piscinibacter sakaiensis]|uniref:GFA family protein n=1 Tax=Piscinibacter sakaiensis TaxID=1547922 RepID=UPI003AADCAED